jgi:fibronectin-binding autotransporter adhesin
MAANKSAATSSLGLSLRLPDVIVLAINAPVQIGDNVGNSGSAQLRLIQSNQIADTQVITVNADGRFDLNGQAETFGPYGAATNAITLVVGETSSGEVAIGAGNLTLLGSTTLANATNILVNVRPGVSSATAPAAVISGTGSLTLNGQVAGQAVTFTVSDGPGESELLVSANVVGATNANLTKAGVGRMTLSGANNTYNGVTTVSVGVLRAASNNAFGSGAGTNEVQRMLIARDLGI